MERFSIGGTLSVRVSLTVEAESSAEALEKAAGLTARVLPHTDGTDVASCRFEDEDRAVFKADSPYQICYEVCYQLYPSRQQVRDKVFTTQETANTHAEQLAEKLFGTGRYMKHQSGLLPEDGVNQDGCFTFRSTDSEIICVRAFRVYF